MGPAQPPAPSGMPDRTGTPDPGIRVVYWHDWGAIAREDRAIDRRQIVDDIFSDKVMGGLALLLIPLLLLIDFARLPPDASAVLSLIDVAIWIFFILEYICRISVAEDRLRYVLSPWHLLDLFIITAPAAALAFEAGYGIARYLRIMRVAQVFQLVKVGGKKVQKRITSRPLPVCDIASGTPLILRSLPLTILPGSVQSDLPGWAEIPLSDQTLPGILKGEWRDFSGWTSADLEILSRFSGLPSYLLEEKLWERSYPRGEITGSSVMIFLRIPRLAQDPADRRKWYIAWDGLFVVYRQDGAMTLSQTKIPLLDRVPFMAAGEGMVLSGPAIVYLIVRESLKISEDIFANAEEQISRLESLPMNRLPSNFTSMMYTDQKVLDRIQSWLHHTKTALEQITGPDQPVRIPETERLPSAINRCSSALDTAETISDSFSRMSDFYLNMTSLSMNQVMKFLAVLTALTLTPAVIGGLMGMNLVGNPWPVTLLPMITAVALIMLLTAWIYFNLGWLKR
jgi:Mg2+ and Co2+ transporter CorA